VTAQSLARWGAVAPTDRRQIDDQHGVIIDLSMITRRHAATNAHDRRFIDDLAAMVVDKLTITGARPTRLTAVS